jgi:fluoroacetyl-CoA thioesterase
MDLQPGTTAELTLLVTADRTADAMGNKGVTVLATPFLIGLLESAAHRLIEPCIPAGGGTVGTMVEMRHLAATPVGMTVTARATLLEMDGHRVLCAVEAWDEREKVAEGRHERFIVADMQRFLRRASDKARSARAE